jgi:hypothetical protein
MVAWLPHSQSSISLVRYLQTFLQTDEERHSERPVVPTAFLLPKNDIVMSGISLIHQSLKYTAFRYKLPFTLRYHRKKIYNTKKIHHCFRTMPKPKPTGAATTSAPQPHPNPTQTARFSSTSYKKSSMASSANDAPRPSPSPPPRSLALRSQPLAL